MTYKQWINTLTKPQLCALSSQTGMSRKTWGKLDLKQLRSGLLSSSSVNAAEGRAIYKEVYGA